MSHQRATLYPLIEQARASLNQLILGNEQSIDIALVGLLSGGHCLIESDQGCGKSTLAKGLARLVSGQITATQCHPELCLDDLISRTNPDKVSGLLSNSLVILEDMADCSTTLQAIVKQAMCEREVLADGKPTPLAADFQIIATQTNQKPLSVVLHDKFLLSTKLQRLNRASERLMFRNPDRSKVLAKVKTIFSAKDLSAIRNAAQNQYTSPHLLDYIQNIIEFSHESDELNHGLSSQAALALLKAAKAYSLLQQRDHVFPEDVQAVLAATVNHRLTLTNSDYESPSALILEKAQFTWWAFG